MKVLSILLLGPAGGFPAELSEALRTAFPMAESSFLPDLASAVERPACPGLELLLTHSSPLPGETAPELLLDEVQLPRWAVLRFGEGNPDLPVAGWSPGALAALLREAASRHTLARDNARLRGELLTIARRVSHDLRTPLGGIIATVDLLAESVPAASASMKPVFSSIDEITNIITRTSFLLKAIAQPLPRTSLNMGTAIREALFRLERPIYQKQATIHQPESWPDVAGVAPWLELIWWNLLHNALQHTGQSPVITLGWEQVDQDFRFHISDSGPGVTTPSPRPVFSPFHLLHDPNATHGLGLPIVRRLTELQGGQCGYTASADGGPTFHFTLPDPHS